MVDGGRCPSCSQFVSEDDITICYVCDEFICEWCSFEHDDGCPTCGHQGYEKYRLCRECNKKKEKELPF